MDIKDCSALLSLLIEMLGNVAKLLQNLKDGNIDPTKIDIEALRARNKAVQDAIIKAMNE
jgi:hypothetical protein